jgi:hypothetical protein
LSDLGLEVAEVVLELWDGGHAEIGVTQGLVHCVPLVVLHHQTALATIIDRWYKST